MFFILIFFNHCISPLYSSSFFIKIHAKGALLPKKIYGGGGSGSSEYAPVWTSFNKLRISIFCAFIETIPSREINSYRINIYLKSFVDGDLVVVDAVSDEQEVENWLVDAHILSLQTRVYIMHNTMGINKWSQNKYIFCKQVPAFLSVLKKIGSVQEKRSFGWWLKLPTPVLRIKLEPNFVNFYSPKKYSTVKN